MKKRVCYALLLMLGAITFLSSCSNDTDYYDSNAASKLQHNKFAETFEKAFGKVAPTVNWGFSETEPSASTRALTRGEVPSDGEICSMSVSEIQALPEADKRAYLKQLIEHDINIGTFLTISQLDAFGFKRIICEDLNVSDNSDFDYNDAVFDAKRIEEAGSGDYATFYTILRAEGAHKLITIGNAEGAYEVHEAFDVSKEVFVNTVNKDRPVIQGAYWKRDHAPVVKIIKVQKRGDNTEPTLIDIPVYAEGNYLPLTAKKGEPAEKICVTTDYSWVEEREHMGSWYPEFIHYVTGEAKTDDYDAFGDEKSWWRVTYWETPESQENDTISVPMTKLYEGTEKFDITENTFGTSLAAFLYEDGVFFAKFEGTPSKVEKNAFKNKESLNKMYVPEGVSAIEEGAFESCTSLSTISLPSTLVTISESAFALCSQLTGLSIPSNVKTIKSNAFEGCVSLTNISLPQSINYVGSGAFRDCTSLTNCTTNSSSDLTSISEYTFYGCVNLTSVTLPSIVESIYDCAFYGCSSLQSISLPSALAYIGKSAFNGCSNLTSISFPQATSYIDNFAFSDCSSLTTVVFANVSSIGESAFIRCTGLTSITLPSSLKKLGDSAFASCANLETVTINATTPPTIQSSFSGCSKLTAIYVPAASVSAYKAADGWSNYADKIKAIE